MRDAGGGQRGKQEGRLEKARPEAREEHQEWAPQTRVRLPEGLKCEGVVAVLGSSYS